MRTLICLAIAALPVLGQEPVRYALSFPNAAHHEAEVRVTFTGVRTQILEVLISRSSPGRYSLHEFPKNVYNFKATDGQGHALTVTQPFDYQWNVAAHKGTVVVEYTVFGDRADGTYDGIDTTHAHLNLPATLAYAHGFEKNPVSLQFAVPEGSGWKVATQLAPHPDGTWTSANMDRMMDSPVELSNHTMIEWKTGASQFRMALHHKGSPEEAAAYAKLIQSVVAEEEGVFGAFPQYDSGTYTFLLDYLPYVNGDGMEHRNSTVIAGTRDLRDSASQLIGTVAHEFFHSWNVKRIRPKTLEPFDYENPNMSGELWFAEGFTNYYGPLALKRAGLDSIERFTRSMGSAVSAVVTAPGRQTFNVVDMSRHAVFFDGGSSNDPTNAANTFISYYTYGQAIALGTDLAIRADFPGKSLDDWMRAMWREHPDTPKPYTLDDLQQTLASVTSKEFATQIFANHIYGKEPMDYEKLLARAGILLRQASTPKIYTGAQGLTFSDRGVDITASTLRASPMYNAGLDRGDRVIEWDGKAIKTLKRLIVEAYGLQPPQIFGGPKWLDENEYDIEAKAGGPATREQLRTMLQPLLEDRFHLKVHRETREMRVWELVVDKGGPRIQPAQDAKPGLMHFHGELPQLASLISVQLSIVPVDDPGRPGVASGPPVPVLDKTGLAGTYDFNLEIRPEADILAMWQRVLQEQLGLKLEARRSQVEGLVVDSAERIPTAN